MHSLIEVETVDHDHDITIEYHYDDDAQWADPRQDCDWNIGTMVCWHRRADLGDVTILPENSYAESLADFIREVIEDREGEGAADAAIVLPLWLYEHGSMTIRTTTGDAHNPFSCPWDSGQVGFIYATPERVAKVGWEPAEARERAVEALVAEVETYDLYLTGQVYGYVIRSGDGEHLDSCWGMLGDLDGYVRETAREEARWWAEVAAWADAEDATHGVPMFVAG